MKKLVHVFTVGIFLTLIFGFAVGFLLLPDQSFSEQENRALRTLPRLTAERLASGDYASDINDYFADQFPLRNLLVGWKGSIELALGKGENDGVLLGRDGQLAKRLFDVARADAPSVQDVDAADTSHLLRSANGICRAAEALEEKGIPLTVMLTGRTLDVCASAFRYPTCYSEQMLSTLRTSLCNCSAYVDAVQLMRARHDAGEAVYYKTDHHWTTLGAYHAYTDLMRAFGMEDEIIPAQAFERTVVSTSFYGSSWSAAGMKFVPPDTVEVWTLGNENAFSVTLDKGAASGFYAWEHLAKKDHYSLFLDGVHDVVTIQKNGEERPTLLILKDSFANSLAPFLAQHFDLILLNLSSTRTDFTNISARAEEYGADAVLVLYTLGNVIENEKIADLR